MIVALQPDQLQMLMPLLYDMWKEQKSLRQDFDAEHIQSGLEYLINNSKDFVILTNEHVDCFLIGHVTATLFFPDLEGFEDLLYIQKDKRGTSRFFKLLKAFEKYCEDRGAITCRVGAGAGIMDDELSEMYIRAGYEPVYKGFKKEIKRCVVVEDVEQL